MTFDPSQETPRLRPVLGLLTVGTGKGCVVRDCGYSKPPPSTQSRRCGLIRVALPPYLDKLIPRHGWQPSRSVIPRSPLRSVNEDRFQELTAALSLCLPVRRPGPVLFLVRAAAPAGEAGPLPGDSQVKASGVVDTEEAPVERLRVALSGR